MTNAEQITLYWKQVEAIEEERTAVDALLEEKADAIRARIRELQPQLPPPEPGSMRDYYARIIIPKMQEIFDNALWDQLTSVDPDKVKIGEPLRIRLPTNYTVTQGL